MPEYKYLIVGGGMTGEAAARGIREVDSDGSIGMISAESDPPYDRPPLSKGLWNDTGVSEIWRGVEELEVDLHLDTLAVRLDAEAHEVADADGETYHYDKLLLATGGTPRELPFEGGNVIYFRTFQDYQRLRELTETRERFAVVGGGFIGSELAAALSSQGKEVTMVFPDSAIGAGRFPDALGEYLNDYYEEHDVKLLTGESVVGFEEVDGGTQVTSDSGERFVVDGVVAGLGIQPNTVLAETAGLEVDNGILVEPTLQTSQPDVYAAGDVAAFYNSALGSRLRVEHEDNANQMGEMAGRSMAGEEVTYDYLPFFYSDLFDLGYEAVGYLDARMETVENWQELGKKGVVYYRHEGRIRGVLLWNVWGKVDQARELIAQPGPIDDDDLAGRLMD